MYEKIIKFINELLYFFTIFIMIEQIILKEYFFVFICFITLLIFLLIYIFYKTFKIRFNIFNLVLNIFIFSSLVLGEVCKYFIIISWWDTLLHIISGFLLTGIGIFLIDVLNI